MSLVLPSCSLHQRPPGMTSSLASCKHPISLLEEDRDCLLLNLVPLLLSNLPGIKENETKAKNRV